MSHYLKYFAAVYSIALILLVSILIYGLKLGAITLLPALIASAFLSARHFIKREQRLPTKKKKTHWFGGQQSSPWAWALS